MKIICFSSNLILYESQIDKKGNIGPAILVMTWHQTGVKPLSEPVIMQVTDVMWHHQATIR